MAADSKNPPIPYGQMVWEPIKPAMRRRMQVCYEHAMKLTQQKGGKYDYDYAHDMLAQCVRADPGNMVYVEALLENLHKKHKNNKRGGGGGGARGPFKKAVKEQHWEEILKLGPDLLKSNPWDKHTLRPLADACGVFGFHEAELRYLKNALDANLKDIEVNKHCAASLARVGQYDQAIGCWRRIGEIRGKSDTESDNMISDLTLQKTRVLTGLGEDDKATGRVVNEGAVPTAPGTTKIGTLSPTVGVTQTKKEPEKRKIELTPRQKLEHAIVEDPEIVDNYLQLADLLLKQQHPAEAVGVLKKGLDAAGGDFRVQEKLEAAEVAHMRLQLAVAEKRAAKDPTDEAKQLIEQMRNEINRKELEIFTGRSNRRPDDVRLKFELAVRLKRVGNFAEAEKTLLEVRAEPKMKAAATIELGECLQQQHKYTNALQFYARAVELTGEGDENLKKLALYRAGTLAMGLKQYPAAEKYLHALSRVDARYRDVLSRLDKVKKLRHKG